MFPIPSRPGPANALTDVPGLRVGHAQRTGDGWLTGTTVVLAPEGGVVAAVDVRGGGPGTRETDALDPRNLVPRIDAIVLTGGSAYGLAAAHGVMEWLEERGRGFPTGTGQGQVVPVVPAASVFDLGRGGDFRARPGPALGRAAAEAAAARSGGQGCVGAGTGAIAGGLRGAVGEASTVLDDGTIVAALTVVNAAGSPIDPRTGLPYALHLGLDGEFPLRRPEAAEHARAQATLAELAAENAPPLNTVVGVVATSGALDRAQAQRFAGAAHDGLARAIRPAHTLLDGDTLFGVATGEHPLAEPAAGPYSEPLRAITLSTIYAAGADVVARAVVHALLDAESVTTPRGHIPAYRELYPSATSAPPAH